jgi:hypothetical protein
MDLEMNCRICGLPVEDDGYGELVHQASGMYEGPEPDGHGHVAASDV